ncbi:glycosyltransferase [Brachyspira aalborgi]|uniref:glycosyltransferase family 2 protein n=1 Tax=Brachyspira aalborgi TaxID=29522 RepID=UPI0011C88FD6|nr:glycosyltransferase family 2 protein [Brachyspira aalborgi]TXJ17204.1 glycosyltransferase [Brachyspira aalborgi]TXJ22758.1 glycosyltransferase [Brachyspira aalborgi]TXJ54313.1 glycosyltransferase [Brachyspira aalborgi]
MKKISVILPTYNEEDNVIPLSKEIVNIFNNELNNYDYEIIFTDNNSIDSTREKIISLCQENKNIKAIFNAKNFGQFRSPFNAMINANGDCVILMVSDFQDPPKIIVDFVREWESGYKIVIGIKNKSKENLIMRFIRTLYYKLMKYISDIEHIEHFTGTGLYDKSFIKTISVLDDPDPYIRGIVSELGYKIKKINYEKQNRKAGKSKNNFFTLYNIAMISITNYSKIVLRLATMIGFLFSFLSFIFGLIYFIYKIIYWHSFNVGIAPLILGVFFIGSIQLFFLGLIGEYILNINDRLMKRPLVIEEKRINFD